MLSADQRHAMLPEPEIAETVGTVDCGLPSQGRKQMLREIGRSSVTLGEAACHSADYLGRQS